MDRIYTEYARAQSVYETEPDVESNEPFATKYAARAILADLVKVELETSIEASLVYFIGKIDYETEDRVAAETNFKRVRSLLEVIKDEEQNAMCFIKATNELAIIWAERDEASKSLEILNEAKELYVTIKSENNKVPWDQWEVLKGENERNSRDERRSKFEEAHTSTLFILAQATKAAGDEEQSALYCGECLQRQLQGDSLINQREWSLHAACLSQYYLTRDDYYTALACLRAASAIMAKVSQDEKRDESLADMNRCWIKFLLGLLEHSKDALVFINFERQMGLQDGDGTKGK